MRKTKRISLKNFILKTVTMIAVMCLLLFGCMMDSESLVPFWIVLTSSVWIVLFLFANAVD